MPKQNLDIQGFLDWEDELPHPRWLQLEAVIEAFYGEGETREAWNSLVGDWLTLLGEALGSTYETAESESFLLLSSSLDVSWETLLKFAESCRRTLLKELPGVMSFDAPGKHAIIVIRNPEDYYRFIAPSYSEGELGASGGVFMGEHYPRVVSQGRDLVGLEVVLAHELTHAALHHLEMPIWLEEGLTQLFEYDMSRNKPADLTQRDADKHRAFFRQHGLDPFWSGEGYLRNDDGHAASYALSVILVRLLIDESRPGWFGLGRDRRRALLSFLSSAKRFDYGESACQECLGYSLSELVAKFLGPGDWSPQSD